mmetsp:Transcript_107100/g.330902  ORF Transcript_107100/g.330902 Transcript_107100/m.330902 type:complete len:814 (-) Transcript_107100:135-2576(-)
MPPRCKSRQEHAEAPQLRALRADGVHTARQLPQHHLCSTACAGVVRLRGGAAQALGGSLRGHDDLLVRARSRCRGCLLLALGEQLGPVAWLGRRQEQHGVVAEPLEQADRPEDLDAQLLLGACLADDLALLQDLLVCGQLLLAWGEPHEGLLLGRQLLGLGVLDFRLLHNAGVHRPVADGHGRRAGLASGAGRVTLGRHEAGARLGPAEEVRVDERPELGGQVLLQLHRPDLGSTHAAAVDGLAEGLDKGGVVAEQPGLRKVHDCPEVLERILHGGARQEDPTAGLELPQALAQQRGDVLHPVGLVADDDVPRPRRAGPGEATGGDLRFDLLAIALRLVLHVVVVQAAALAALRARSALSRPALSTAFAGLPVGLRRGCVVDGDVHEVLRVADHAVGREEQASFRPLHTAESLHPLGLGAVVGVDGPTGAPDAGLLGPLVQERHRKQQQRVRGPQLARAVEQRADLNGLPKTHLVSKDSTLLGLVDAGHPGHSSTLIGVEALKDVTRQREGWRVRLLAGQLHEIRAWSRAPLPRLELLVLVLSILAALLFLVLHDLLGLILLGGVRGSLGHLLVIVHLHRWGARLPLVERGNGRRRESGLPCRLRGRCCRGSRGQQARRSLAGQRVGTAKSRALLALALGTHRDANSRASTRRLRRAGVMAQPRGRGHGVELLPQLLELLLLLLDHLLDVVGTHVILLLQLLLLELLQLRNHGLALRDLRGNTRGSTSLRRLRGLGRSLRRLRDDRRGRRSHAGSHAGERDLVGVVVVGHVVVGDGPPAQARPPPRGHGLVRLLLVQSGIKVGEREAGGLVAV